MEKNSLLDLFHKSFTLLQVRCQQLTIHNCFEKGSSADWAYDTADIPCSYAVELRDEGRYGFLLPESEIKPVEEEMFAAFKKMADHVIDGRCETKQLQELINCKKINAVMY